MNELAAIQEFYESLPANEQELLKAQLADQARIQRWVPSPGPQTEAYFSHADVLLYGGQAAGGKTDEIVGLALTQHRRSLILRRQYTDLGAITERACEVNGTRNGFNGSSPPKLRTIDGRLIDFGAAQNIGDENSWDGQPHDLIAFDEAVHFAESQVRHLMGWNRSAVPGQRCRVIMATNPPVGSEGWWIIPMFAPWLDPTYENPAKPGELRWVVTDERGEDLWVNGPGKVLVGTKEVKPLSRTFIPARLSDNPYLRDTDYASRLDSLKEPLRSAIRDGNFMAARSDEPFQVIPSAWVRAAQQRWTPTPPRGVPMCAIGVDVAQGGKAETVFARRYDGWYAPMVAIPGDETPDGPTLAGRLITYRRDHAIIIVDCGGGYGGSAYDHLKANEVEVQAYKATAASVRRTVDGQLKFANRRSEVYWRFREALDPDQPGGSPIMLPDDPKLMADLTAVTFEVTGQGIKALVKDAPRKAGSPDVPRRDSVVKKLGRSPDRGDAVVLAWAAGPRALTDAGRWREDQRHYGRKSATPRVDYGPRRPHGMRHR